MTARVEFTWEEQWLGYICLSPFHSHHQTGFKDRRGFFSCLCCGAVRDIGRRLRAARQVCWVLLVLLVSLCCWRCTTSGKYANVMYFDACGLGKTSWMWLGVSQRLWSRKTSPLQSRRAGHPGMATRLEWASTF